jgi:hypothetical protein
MFIFRWENQGEIVYRKLSCRITFLFSVAMVLASAAVQAQTPQAAGTAASSTQPAAAVQAPSATATVASQTAPAVTGTLHGHIADPSGALIPGTIVSVATADGKSVGKATADAAGAYQVHGLPAGSYVIEATFEGFAPFVSSPIQLSAGQSKNVDIKMAIEQAEQQVVVTDEGAPTVSTEAGANASAMVLKGSDLDALSDDPDELSNELSALAGPSAGPNGGQIYIDGFSGGQLPPKSAIREIRINQNPFSAEFDKLGYGRIEILTKPGTDTLHGRAFLMGNDDAFNTKNPFTGVIPAYYKIQYNGSVSGSMSKWASYFFSVEGRNFQDADIYDITNPVLLNSQTNSYFVSGTPLTGSLFTPQTHLEVSPRVDLQLGQKNTLTLRYQFFRQNQSGILRGATSLPSLATSSYTNENAFQLMDSQIISESVVNETRLQYRRGNTTTTPVSTAPSFGVPQLFSDGGSSGQNSKDHSDHLELQNITTMTRGTQAIKLGLWARDNRDAQSTDAGFNGSFTFPSADAYAFVKNEQNRSIALGSTQFNSDCTAAQATDSNLKAGCLPNKLSYTTGPLGSLANVFDAALFVQDDWKFRPYLTLSGGLRWETQNHTADHSDFGPRVAFAYALDGHKKGTVSKTVLRGGFGLFFDRFGTGNLMDLEQFSGNGKSQTQTVISNPTCFTSTAEPASWFSANCGAGTAKTNSIYTLSSAYRAATSEQIGASLERQATKTSTISLTFLHTLGVHQLVTRDANAFLPGTYQYGSTTLTGTRPDPNLGLVDQYFSEAVFKQNQFIVNMNARLRPNFSVMGYYSLNFANADTGTASNAYNLTQDYGRASFVSRNMVFLMGNYTGKWGISYNPFLVVQSGRPFNLVTPYDLTGDNEINLDRPAFAATSDCTAGQTRYIQNSYGCFDTTPGTGENIIPINFGNGPAAVTVNLRVSRSFGVGPKVESPGGPQRGGGGFGGPGGPGGPGGGGGGRGGGGFGGGGFGGGGMRGGGPMGGNAGTGRKYSLNFSAQALNLFNDINYGTPVGNVAAQNFGKSISLQGGGGPGGSIFGSPSAARRIFIQAAFQF